MPDRIDELKDLLNAAVKLELSTIPPYLCALYSIHARGNDEAKLVIRSVVVEEMLHMVLAANVLNAIGGEPRISGTAHAPRYPHELPDGVVLDLLPFTPESVEAFLKVENPGDTDHHCVHAEDPLVAGRRPEHHESHALAHAPRTIGEFYALIEQKLEEACAELGEQAVFSGDPARQVSDEYYYAGGGRIIAVEGLDAAKRALGEIVEQGEGELHSMYDDDGHLAHYFRFMQLKFDRAYLPADDAGDPTGPAVGVDYSAVFPMLANPKSAEYDDDPELRAASDAHNRTWSLLLMQVEAAFNGQPDLLVPAVHSMFRLRDQMVGLLGVPLPDHPGRNAGPTFEWVDVPALTPLAASEAV